MYLAVNVVSSVGQELRSGGVLEDSNIVLVSVAFFCNNVVTQLFNLW
jgi:hypothetical protein